MAERLVRALDGDRKDAKTVNRELLDWLKARGSADRPFFAFLNYNDAHYPYQLPPGRLHRFGTEPIDPYQRLLIRQWGLLDKKTVSSAGVAFAIDAYDDCIADLDEQLGILFDALDRLGLRQRTWLFIVADHGESFGEHPGYFTHGTSLYDTELHVPLVVSPPGGTGRRQVATEAVSLRDVAATIVNVVGLGAARRSPAPRWLGSGRRLTRMAPESPHRFAGVCRARAARSEPPRLLGLDRRPHTARGAQGPRLVLYPSRDNRPRAVVSLK